MTEKDLNRQFQDHDDILCDGCNKMIDQELYIRHWERCIKIKWEKKRTDKQAKKEKIAKTEREQKSKNQEKVPLKFECRHCNMQIDYNPKIFEEHEQVCPCIPKKCDYCQDTFPASLMQEHLNVCEIKEAIGKIGSQTEERPSLPRSISIAPELTPERIRRRQAITQKLLDEGVLKRVSGGFCNNPNKAGSLTAQQIEGLNELQDIQSQMITLQQTQQKLTTDLVKDGILVKEQGGPGRFSMNSSSFTRMTPVQREKFDQLQEIQTRLRQMLPLQNEDHLSDTRMVSGGNSHRNTELLAEYLRQMRPQQRLSEIQIGELKQVRCQTSDEICTICQQKMQVGCSMIELQCYHRFHSDCIAKWLRKNASCPLCKKNMKNK